MDSLSGISVFVQVADTRSFLEAGRLLGISSSAVGKSVARLEQRLGVRLFHRNTRSIALTAEGGLFLARCRRILNEVDAAEAELLGASDAPRGRLRVSMPQLPSLMMPVLDGFMQSYPDIELDIDMSDRMVDIVEEGFDAVIRTGMQHDSRLVAKRLGTCPQLLVAAKDYLERHGEPETPRDLTRHACLRHKFNVTGKLELWPLRRNDEEEEFAIPETMIVSTVDAIAYAAIEGRGIAFLPNFLVRDALRRGQLRIVLADYVNQQVTFRIMWPASRYAAPKLRALIDYVTEHLDIEG
ncbi:LysR family transcriptional regulator [Herbaspirillum frisingense]|uniref:LysR family transcriptional regulator n=1 Tax=Herbaspirillum frisingense TaxID=92645 RepID=UPI001600CCDA|nr:LysR family transcriptional regulator [Herbaspirillum frisingense]QNB09866.1 LysR family transcriptional regulator [Herbaspirillum frisingense]